MALRWLPRHCDLDSLLLLVLSAALIASAAGPVRAQERLSIALLPVVVHSAESPDYLRWGLADMLSSRFEQAGAFRVIRVDDSAKSTTRLSEALELGREVGADFVLFGSFTRFGAGASLDMQAAATAHGESGETLREIFVHSGSIGEVIPDLEDLVGKVTRFANADYTPSEASAAGPSHPSTAGSGSRELAKRVATLEKLVQDLRKASEVGE